MPKITFSYGEEVYSIDHYYTETEVPVTSAYIKRIRREAEKEKVKRQVQMIQESEDCLDICFEVEELDGFEVYEEE